MSVSQSHETWILTFSYLHLIGRLTLLTITGLEAFLWRGYSSHMNINIAILQFCFAIFSVNINSFSTSWPDCTIFFHDNWLPPQRFQNAYISLHCKFARANGLLYPCKAVALMNHSGLSLSFPCYSLLLPNGKALKSGWVKKSPMSGWAGSASMAASIFLCGPVTKHSFKVHATRLDSYCSPPPQDQFFHKLSQQLSLPFEHCT